MAHYKCEVRLYVIAIFARVWGHGAEEEEEGEDEAALWSCCCCT